MTRSSNQGVTLIELLVTLSLIAIVLSLAAPSFRELMLNNQRASHINAMMASLNLARAEAAKRGAEAVVCITDGASPPDCDTGATQWEDGWLVVVDRDKDGTVTRADGDLILEAHEALQRGVTFRGNANVSWRVPYSSRGTSTNGTLTLCDSRGQGSARGIVVYYTGRPRLTTEADGPLTCPP